MISEICDDVMAKLHAEDASSNPFLEKEEEFRITTDDYL